MLIGNVGQDPEVRYVDQGAIGIMSFYGVVWQKS